MGLSIFPQPSSAAPAATQIIGQPVGALPAGLTLHQTINATSNNISGLPPLFFVVATGGGSGGQGGRGGNSPSPGGAGVAGSSIAFWANPFTSCVIGAGGGGGAGGGNNFGEGSPGGNTTAGPYTFPSLPTLGGASGVAVQQFNFPSGIFSNTRMVGTAVAGGAGGAGGNAYASGSSGGAGSVLIYVPT